MSSALDRLRDHGAETPWWQTLGFLVLSVATAVLCYLALTGNTLGNGDDVVVDPPASNAVDGGSPSDPGSGADPGGSAEPPTVPDQRRADFSKGDDLPDGARTFNTGDNVSGMALTPDGLTHGRPTGSGAAGLVETKLKSDVRSLGFRVVFADDDSGSVALIASRTSIVEAFESEAPAPSTGMRLVAVPGSWELTVDDVADEQQLIGSGTYEAAPGPATFQIIRDGETVFVVDPTGARTQVTDPLVDALSGPWAAWGLLEDGRDQTPAVIEAVWGG